MKKWLNKIFNNWSFSKVFYHCKIYVFGILEPMLAQQQWHSGKALASGSQG
jgi:hypothetical protein